VYNGEITLIFKRLFGWMGVPQVATDQLLGYEEVPCICKDPRCSGVRARLSAEFHVVKNKDGQLAAEQVKR
jgi:hypothetical protein